MKGVGPQRQRIGFAGDAVDPSSRATLITGDASRHGATTVARDSSKGNTRLHGATPVAGDA